MSCIAVLVLAVLAVGIAAPRAAGAGRTLSHPDFKKIRTETLNPESQYYYPGLLKRFYSSDTTMTDDEYHYLYYGTVFQEDYNPYRDNPYADELKATEPLYSRRGTLSRNEKTQIQKLAEKSLANNPFDLRQMSYLVFAYDNSGKQNLAKIWRHKYNKILQTIAASGSGADKEHAIVVVYPSNEIDFFFLVNIDIEDRMYEEPYYEKLTVRAPGATEPRDYWFDLHHLLEQYYAKHPSEE